MNKQYYIRKLLDTSQLNSIDSLIAKSNKNNSWVGGTVSTIGPKSNGGKSSIKNNLELSDENIISGINSIIMNSLDLDFKFLNYTVANQTTKNIVSKTISGGYYNPHLDLWSCGDYSTTVFLSNPEEYSGGELCLFLNEEEKKIKLDKGYAITYHTGTPHRVNRVISGERYVSVFWTTSLLKDDFIRQVYYELTEVLSLSEKKSIHHATCYSMNTDPYHMIDNLKNEILRKYCI